MIDQDEGAARWRARVQRERSSRKEAERLLEAKSIELYEANQELKKLADDLEHRFQDTSEALEKREQTFSTLFQKSLDGIILHDSEGRITEANREIVRMLGYPVEKLRRMLFSELYPEDDLETCHKASAEVNRILGELLDDDESSSSNDQSSEHAGAAELEAVDEEGLAGAESDD